MVSCRLALIVLVCTVAAAQSQRQFAGRKRFGSQPSSTSVTSEASSRGRSSLSRASTSQTSSRRTGSGFGRTMSQASSRAGGSSFGGATSQASSRTGPRFGGRATSQASTKPGSTFGRTRASTTTTGGRSSVGSTFGRQKKTSTTTTGGRSSFGSNRRQPQTTTRQSSFRATGRAGAASRTPARPGTNRATSETSRATSGFNRGSSAATRGSRPRAQTRPQLSSGRSPVRGGAQKNTLLKQSPTVNYNCPEADGFFPNGGQCDKYYECREGVAREHTCPDGLLFHPNRSYPCVYPIETECDQSSTRQNAQSTGECPRQFATFKALDDEGCGAFTQCVHGRMFRSACPEALAFNTRTLGCEYADEVDGCDAAAYLGFQCPAIEFTAAEVGEFTREPHPSDCTMYYICVNKADGSVQPRLQGCPLPAVFDVEKGVCNNQPQEVAGCEDAIPAGVLAAFQQRKDDEAERRANRLSALKERLQG